MIYKLPLGSDILEFITGVLTKHNKTHCDYSDFLVIFPNKKPEYHLYKKLTDTVSSHIIPPSIFSIDNFFRFINNSGNREIKPVEAISILYYIIKKHLNIKELNEIAINDFYEWGLELYNFFEGLFSEKIDDNTLKSTVNLSFPAIYSEDSIIENLPALFSFYKMELKNRSLTTIRMIYNNDSDIARVTKFKHIIFAGFFDPTKCEIDIINKLYETINDRLIYIIQDDEPSGFDPLKNIEKKLGQKVCSIEDKKTKAPLLELIEGYDTHSQVLGLQSRINEDKSICIVLPDSTALIPVLYEIVPNIDQKFSISMGYPFSMTSLYKSMTRILNLQKSKTTDGQIDYYSSKEYISLIRDDLIIDLPLYEEKTIRTFLCDLLKFITEKDILEIDIDWLTEAFHDHRMKCCDINSERNKTLEKNVLKSFHYYFLKGFNEIKSWADFSEYIHFLASIIVKNNEIINTVFGPDICRALTETLEEINNLITDRPVTDLSDILSFFIKVLSDVYIEISGMPVAEGQILGVLETRCLNFDHVYILDFNEGPLPRVNQAEPLIPDFLRRSLKTDHRQRKTEIYRYYTRRLISGSQKTCLIYNNAKEKQRSRFIEEIIWELQQQKKEVPEAFKVSLLSKTNYPEDIIIKKNSNSIQKAENITYTPTKIDTYLKCPLRFYLNYILCLETSETEAGELSFIDVGNLVHRILEFSLKLYKQIQYSEKNFDMEQYLRTIHDYFDRESKVSYHGKEKGSFFLFKTSFKIYLDNFIKKTIEHIKNNIINVLCVEEKLTRKLRVDKKLFLISGKADRIDKINDIYCIIDYKTGGFPNIKTEIILPEKDYSRENIKENTKSLQLPLYLYLFDKFPCDAFFISFRNIENSRGLFHKNINELYLQTEKESLTGSKDYLYNVYVPQIKYLLKEITNPCVPYLQDRSDLQYCMFCQYKSLCH